MLFEREAAVSLITADFPLRRQMDRVEHFGGKTIILFFFFDSLKNDTKIYLFAARWLWEKPSWDF